MNINTAPWTADEVRRLNEYQRDGLMHPFTCPNSPHEGKPKQDLVATEEGWTCPGCEYTQNWAHGFMLTWDSEKARAAHPFASRGLGKLGQGETG